MCNHLIAATETVDRCCYRSYTLNMRKDVDLEQRVRRDLAFLFDDHGATVRSNTIEDFGNSEVIVAAGNLDFQFANNQMDGELKVSVGPRNGHGVWELLHVALAASTGEDAMTLTFPISYANPA